MPSAFESRLKKTENKSAIDSLIEESRLKAISDKKLLSLKVDQISRSPYQPRLDFDQIEINDLAVNIEAHGLKQPIMVRLIHENQYELICGERRLTAIRDILKQTEIDAYVVALNDEETAITALLENTERSNLSGYEEALYFKNYCEKFQMEFKPQKIKDRFAIPESRIYRLFSYFKLPQAIIDTLSKYPKSISPTTASLFCTEISDAKLVEKDSLVDQIAFEVWSNYLDEYQQTKKPLTKFLADFKERIENLSKQPLDSTKTPDVDVDVDVDVDANADSSTPDQQDSKPKLELATKRINFKDGSKSGSLRVTPTKDDDVSVVQVRINVKNLTDEKLEMLTNFLSENVE